MVVNFLKKYWLGLLLSTSFVVILIFLTPIQEKVYANADFQEFKKAISKYSAIVAGIILLLFLLISLRNKPSLTDFVLYFLRLLLLGLPLWFWLNTFGFYLALQINKVNSQTLSSKKYTIERINKKYESLYLYDLENGKLIQEDNLLKNKRLNSAKQGDTIAISYKKGLLGYRFNPVVQQ